MIKKERAAPMSSVSMAHLSPAVFMNILLDKSEKFAIIISEKALPVNG